MNVNYQPQMQVIDIWLKNATKQLSDVGISSARLDSEILLSKALNKNRTFLHAHPEQIICSKQVKIVNSYLKKRLKLIPISYILGYKEFYGRNFKVSKATLTPRPESEAIIDVLSNIIKSFPKKDIKLIDIGTGSGCLGITAKLEFPYLDVTLVDISLKALNVAKINSKALMAPVKVLRSDLFNKYHDNVDIIIANLPYVDKSWDYSPEIKHEPSLALFADDHGLSIIKRLIIQSKTKINLNGYLIIESDPSQHNSLINFAERQSFNLFSRSGYVLAFIYSNKIV